MSDAKSILESLKRQYSVTCRCFLDTKTFKSHISWLENVKLGKTLVGVVTSDPRISISPGQYVLYRETKECKIVWTDYGQIDPTLVKVLPQDVVWVESL